MAKTIADYSKDYFAAKEKGDSDAMRVANDAANAIRASQGQAAQDASQDIRNVAAKGGGSSGLYNTTPVPTSNTGGGSNSKSSGFTGSASGIQGYNEVQKKLLNQMNQNSIAWWDADETSRGSLAAQNEELARQLSNAGLPVYKDANGRWNAIPQQEIQSPHLNAFNAYDAMLQAQNEQARALYQAMVQQGTDRLNAQKGDIHSAYDDAAQKAYISYMQGQRNLPGQLASLGMTGGASESALIQAQTGYEGNVNAVNTGRNKAMGDVDLAIRNLQNSGDVQTAQAILENAGRSAEGYIQAAYADIGRGDDLSKWAYQKAVQDAGLTGMYNGNPTMDAQQAAFSRAQALLSMGFSNAEIARMLGITEAEARQYADMVSQGMQIDLSAAQAALNKKLSTSGGSGRSYARSGGTSYATGSIDYYEDDPDSTLDPLNWTVNQTDSTGTGWVNVPGYSRVTLAELERMVDRGEVLEGTDPETGKKTYRKNPNYGK